MYECHARIALLLVIMCCRRAPTGFRLMRWNLISIVTAVAVDPQNTTRMYVATETDTETILTGLPF